MEVTQLFVGQMLDDGEHLLRELPIAESIVDNAQDLSC